MATLAIIGSVIRRYGWLILFTLGAVLTAAIVIVARWRTASKPVIAAPSVVDAVQAELAGIRAEGALEREIAKKGLIQTRAEIELAYEHEKYILQDDERRQAEALRADPVRLAGFLARAASRRSRQ